MLTHFITLHSFLHLLPWRVHLLIFLSHPWRQGLFFHFYIERVWQKSLRSMNPVKLLGMIFPDSLSLVYMRLHKPVIPSAYLFKHPQHCIGIGTGYRPLWGWQLCFISLYYPSQPALTSLQSWVHCLTHRKSPPSHSIINKQGSYPESRTINDKG